MIVSIYASECVLMRGDDRCAVWTEYRFDHRPMATQETAIGNFKIRRPLGETKIKSPLATRSPGGRFLTLHDGKSYCAEVILAMAKDGMKGMRILPEGSHEN